MLCHVSDPTNRKSRIKSPSLISPLFLEQEIYIQCTLIDQSKYREFTAPLSLQMACITYRKKRNDIIKTTYSISSVSRELSVFSSSCVLSRSAASTYDDVE